MKTFVAILVIVVCFETILLFKSVNGDIVKILTSDGKYIPGSAFGWNAILDDIEKHSDAEGRDYVQYWRNTLEPIDKALSNGDLAAIGAIFRRTAPVIRKLVPYLNDEKLKEIVTGIADNGENLIASLEVNDGNMSGLSKFFESESTNLGKILVKVIETVVDLVDNVGGVVGGVLHSFKSKQ